MSVMGWVGSGNNYRGLGWVQKLRVGLVWASKTRPVCPSPQTASSCVFRDDADICGECGTSRTPWLRGGKTGRRRRSWRRWADRARSAADDRRCCDDDDRLAASHDDVRRTSRSRSVVTKRLLGDLRNPTARSSIAGLQRRDVVPSDRRWMCLVLESRRRRNVVRQFRSKYQRIMNPKKTRLVTMFHVDSVQ